MHGIKLTAGYEGDYGVNYYSQPWTESDWPIVFVVAIEFTEKYDREWAKSDKHHVSVKAVAPDAVHPDTLARAMESFGMTREQYDALPPNGKVELLAEYGTCAVLWQASGNNRRKLERQAREELAKIQMVFGFYMDKPQNAMGDTGWDWIKGDIGGQHRQAEEQAETVPAGDDVGELPERFPFENQ